MDANNRRAAEKWGRRAEELAVLLLRAKGYRILARRFRTPRGELDIVARRGAMLAVIEVKARRHAISALTAVTPHNRRRLAQAAALFLASRPDLAGLNLRFDIIAITPTAWPRHIRSAFGHEAP